MANSGGSVVRFMADIASVQCAFFATDMDAAHVMVTNKYCSNDELVLNCNRNCLSEANTYLSNH